ncbi:MAG: tyrosine recombinase [Spirochaetaceae bacterium]|jgi:integrase/recombinase XerD|nr:tyrosine recombinase [Spirochaetaceae bacterium]
MDGQTLLDRYYTWILALERRSFLTAETYKSEIRRFLEWLEKKQAAPEQVDTSALMVYLNFRKDTDGIDARSTAKAISALRSFYRYLVDEGLRLDNPAGVLEAPKRGLRLPEVLNRQRVDELLALVPVDTPRGLRDRALFEFIYSAGLRVSEAVLLNVKDIYFTEGLARVLGKGNKERLVPFGEEAAFWLKRYLADARPHLAGKVRSPALFIGKTGRRLSRKGIWKNYKKPAALAGLPSKLHTLRHSYATELLAGGADLRSVQELLGHSDITTTQIYTHVDVSLLRESHRRYMPKLRDVYPGPNRVGG